MRERSQLTRTTLDGPSRELMRSRKASVIALLIAAPAYVVGAVLLVVAALHFASATQPGETIDDMRPTDDVATAMGALLTGVALLFLGYFAAKRPTVTSSLIVTACFAVGFVLFMLFAASRGNDATYLALAAAFAYPGLIALVRLVGQHRAPRSERS